MICGPPEAGKSFLIQELINNPLLYYGKFDKVLYISPNKIPGLES